MTARYLSIACILGAACLSSLRIAQAQHVQFRHYSSDEGFTGAAFKKIAQDSIGFLWISSGAGIHKFDGYDFISYRSDPNDSLSLPKENSAPIWIDPKGRLWAGYAQYLVCFDRHLNGFIKYKISLLNERASSLYFESEHVLWLGTSRGLFRVDLENKEEVFFNIEENGGTEHRISVNDILDRGTFLLVSTSHGLWHFDKSLKKFYRSHEVFSPLSNEVIIKSFINHDYYWFWTSKSIIKTDLSFNIIEQLNFKSIHEKFDIHNKQKDAQISSVVVDSTSVVWLGSLGLGLIRYNSVTNELTNFRYDPHIENSIPSDMVCDVFIDRDKNVWVATVTKGLAILKEQSLQFFNYLPQISTTSMVLLSRNQLIVATQGEGLWTSTINSVDLNALTFKKIVLPKIEGFQNILSLKVIKDNLWVGSFRSGIMQLPIDSQMGQIKNQSPKIFKHDHSNPKNTLTVDAINGFELDKDGNLLVSTLTNGLNKIFLEKKYGEEGSVHHFLRDALPGESNPTQGLGISDFSVLDLLREDDSTFWVAAGGNLTLFRNEKFEIILKDILPMRVVKSRDGKILVGTKSGLYEGAMVSERYIFNKVTLIGTPFITSIQEDKLGRYWLLTYEGIIFYDPQKKITLLFKKDDGLPATQTLSAGRSAQTEDGIMIFANAEGVVIFDPLSLNIETNTPRPVFTKLKINNKVVNSGRTDTGEFSIPQSINTISNLTFNYTQNIFSLEFSAVDFAFPEKNKYLYKLEGFDKEWIQTDWKNRSATYSNLQPGDYIFKVKASNRDGVWNEFETTLLIHVLPPPWKTGWAYTLYGVVFAGILFTARRNIIQRERLASKLQLEHMELEKVQEIDKAKTNFFANISHEFRTPLTLIHGPVQNLLQQFKKNREVTFQLNMIYQNTDRLLRLVNQILELAKLESGGLKKEISEGELVSFLNRVVGSFSSLAVQRRISLVPQFPEKAIRSRFDKDKLEKIVSNLIANALKFTPEGGAIIIHVELNHIAKDANLIISVTDTGKGIPLSQRDKIFERFYQVNENENQNVGTGIGLALCKELAEFLGGGLTVESKVGEGSKFTLIVPVEIVEIANKVEALISPSFLDERIAEPLLSKGNPTSEAINEKPLLLIVEDHTELRKFIISCIGHDYQFMEAANGLEGLALAIEQIPELILSDVMMPGMDGIEMCNKIKRDHRTSHIPVILLTAKASNESKLSGLGIGADDYLIKPFNKEELILKIRNQITIRIKMQEKLRLDLLSESSTINVMSEDEKFLDLVKKVIEARLGDGQLGVEMVAAEVGLSRAQLYRKVVALTGIPVSEFVRRLRLQKASQLIRQNWGSVSQVAYEVGFTNLSYFSKCFKEQFGVLPSEYTLKQ